ncbi:transposase [Streptomyces sp. SID9727]|uniref:transposase n=1 Tax=Streptomyces sp. SID9727 TaxID=2706114 RepID=UPI001EF3853A|nr:transposase [Streptomyces sp. SID9727]
MEILTDASHQSLGAQTGGRVVTPPHRNFKKNAPEWYEEMHERQHVAHSSRRIRDEHGISHLKNWRSLARLHGRREHMTDTIQAVAGLLAHQQAGGTRKRTQLQIHSPRRATTNHARARWSCRSSPPNR